MKGKHFYGLSPFHLDIDCVYIFLKLSRVILLRKIHKTFQYIIVAHFAGFMECCFTILSKSKH